MCFIIMVFFVYRLWDQIWSDVLYNSYNANFILGNEALIFGHKAVKLCHWRRYFVAGCVLTGNWATCLSLLHTMLDWGEDERLVMHRTLGSTETVKWLERFIVLLVQTTVVLYCSAMEYGATLFPVNAWQSLVALVSLYESLRSWTWLCRTLKSLGTIKTAHRMSI